MGVSFPLAGAVLAILFDPIAKSRHSGLDPESSSCESVEFTGFRIRSGMTEIKDSGFLQQHHGILAAFS